MFPLKGSKVKSSGRTDRYDNNRAAVAPLPLVPGWILIPLWCVALALPNLIYSGLQFADTLHIMKWTVAGVPVAIASFVAGWRLIQYGGKRLDFHVDLFGSLLALMLIYCAAMPIWTRISSMTGMVHEMICLLAVWAFYVISAASFPNRGLRPLLWLANVNAAVNVLFAELQIRGLNDLAFLEGTPFAWLRSFSRLILPTPGNYIGNTAQQNMFGLWMAICVMSSVYLFIAYAVDAEGRKRPLWLTVLNLLLMTVNVWGLWNSTSRSGIFSLLVGLFVLGFVTVMHFGRIYVKRLVAVLLLFGVVLGGSMLINRERSSALISKTGDMVQNAWTMGGRIGIWTTSMAMFKEYPAGVGVGQYKWHYLEAQREAFKTNNEPWYVWQYTHWAHNEFLQWFCEAGIVGGVMLLLLFGLWGVAVLLGLFRGRELPSAAIWACALVALIAFNAFWTRPFHRIENILWLTLAFAVTNREVLTGRLGWRAAFSRSCLQFLGAVFLIASVGGVGYLVSGIEGNLLLRRALSTTNAAVQLNYLERAAAHPIVREDALKNLGYHYLQVGEQTNDINTMGRGFGILLDHFHREPYSEDMSRLLNWAQRFQVVDVIEELAGYLKPGTYVLRRQSGAQDQQGRPVDALMLTPVQNSGGMRFAEISGERQSMDSQTSGNPASR